MPLIQFSLDNSLYIGLLTLSGFGQIKALEGFEELSKVMMLLMFLESFGLLLLVICEDISLAITKRFQPRLSTRSQKLHCLSQTKQKITLIKAKNWVKYKRPKMFISVIILGFLTTVNTSLIVFFYLTFLVNLNGGFSFLNFLITWLLLAMWSFSRMYYHHIMALTILLTGVIVSFATNIYMLEAFIYMLDETYLSFFITFVCISIIQSSREVLEKYTLDVLKIKHFKLLFFTGITSTILNLMYFLIFQYVDCNKQINFIRRVCLTGKTDELIKLIHYIFRYCSLESLYSFMYIISTMLVHSFRILINKKSGPTHKYSADLLTFELHILYSMLSNLIKGTIQLYTWGVFVLIFILIIAGLIYNENIRINVWQLSTYTRYEIDKRAKNEDLQLEENLYEIGLLDETIRESSMSASMDEINEN